MTIANWFRPKWKHSNPDVRQKAVTSLTNQSVLAYIAKNDDHANVRKTANDTLTDIAKNDKDSKVRLAAVQRVTDQNLLADIAKHEQKCKECAGEWFDYTMAAHMVKDRKSVHSVQRVGNLNLDVLVMTTHGLTVIDDYLRHLARDWWAGQAESRTVATCDACSVGPVARNEGYLLGSHLWCEECYTSKNVKGQLKRNPDAAGNGMLLKAVHWAAKYYAENHVKKSDDALVRKEATERVTDRDVLADIAKNDKDRDVRQAAESRIKMGTCEAPLVQ